MPAPDHAASVTEDLHRLEQERDELASAPLYRVQSVRELERFIDLYDDEIAELRRVCEGS